MWGGKQSSNGSIDWGNGYNLGYHELIAQDAIGDWNTGYTEVTVPSQFNTACLFFQIEQSEGSTGTSFYVTNVTVTDTTQSQFVQQHMTFDSTGLRVYGNDVNKCVLINEAGVRIQRDDANRVEVNSGSINLVVGNKNSISLHTNNISLYGGRNNLYDSDGVLAGFIGVGNANWPTASGYSNITHGIALASSDRSDSGVFLMDGKNKSIVVAHANSDNSTVLYNINSILTKSGYYGAKYILRYLTYDTPGFGDIPEHYAYYFAGILVGISNSVPSGYPVLMTSGGVASVWSYNSGGKIV